MTRYLQLSLGLFTELQASLQPRFHLELGLVRMVQAGRLMPIEQALAGMGPAPMSPPIPVAAWKDFIRAQFKSRRRKVTEQALDRLMKAADLIPYDVQRTAHELWDYAELADRAELDIPEVDLVIDELVRTQSEYFERLWEQLTFRQRAVLQALSHRGPTDLHSQAGREEYRLGAASTVQKALQSLDSQDILDRYHGAYFFVDPLFATWVRKSIE